MGSSILMDLELSSNAIPFRALLTYWIDPNGNVVLLHRQALGRQWSCSGKAGALFLVDDLHEGLHRVHLSVENGEQHLACPFHLRDHLYGD